MKKLTWTWKKAVTLIGTALGIGMLVSCYGMPPNWTPEDYDWSDYEYENEESEDTNTSNDSEQQN